MPGNCTQVWLICDWSDQFGYLLQYRHPNFLERQGVEIEIVYGMTTFKQNPCLAP